MTTCPSAIARRRPRRFPAGPSSGAKCPSVTHGPVGGACRLGTLIDLCRAYRVGRSGHLGHRGGGRHCAHRKGQAVWAPARNGHCAARCGCLALPIASDSGSLSEGRSDRQPAVWCLKGQTGPSIDIAKDMHGHLGSVVCILYAVTRGEHIKLT